MDDEEILVKLGQVMLAKLGYEVDGLSSSSKALDVFRTDPSRYDMVITDMTMPGMTGVELAQELLSIRQDLPIILCTGFHDSISPVKAKQLGLPRVCSETYFDAANCWNYSTDIGSTLLIKEICVWQPF